MFSVISSYCYVNGAICWPRRETKTFRILVLGLSLSYSLSVQSLMPWKQDEMDNRHHGTGSFVYCTTKRTLTASLLRPLSVHSEGWSPCTQQSKEKKVRITKSVIIHNIHWVHSTPYSKFWLERMTYFDFHHIVLQLAKFKRDLHSSRHLLIMQHLGKNKTKFGHYFPLIHFNEFPNALQTLTIIVMQRMN